MSRARWLKTTNPTLKVNTGLVVGPHLQGRDQMSHAVIPNFTNGDAPSAASESD